MELVLEKKNASLSDPGRFAQAIRDIAYDAHHSLRHSPSPEALRMLARRIEVLSSTLGNRRGDPLKAWLENVGREVRSAALQRARSSRPLCLCG